MNDSLNQAALQLRQYINQFVALSDQEWRGLEPYLSIVQLKKHQHIATQGVVADQVAFVLEGVFRQFYSKDGEDRTTYFFFGQQLMAAYMSCVTARPSPVTIEALSEATCLVFPYSVIKSLFGQYMGWQTFGRLIAEYLMVALEERMAGLLLLSPEERYLALLEGDQRHILQRVPQHYIATIWALHPSA